MNKVKKVIIPAAGWGTRFLPFTKQVPKELSPVLSKPLLHYLVEETYESGIEEVIIVTSPRKADMVNYFSNNPDLEEMLESKGKVELLKVANSSKMPIKITIVLQHEQKGLAHAISMAYEEVGEEPFGVILGDDLIRSNTPALKQLIEAYNDKEATILGVQSVPEKDVHKYGVIDPLNKEERNNKLIEIKGAVEKPNAEVAPSHKAMIGRYVFSNKMMKLFKGLKQQGNNEINVVDAFEELLKEEKIYAFELEGTRYDLGSKEGFVKANIDYALEDKDIAKVIKEFINEK